MKSRSCCFTGYRPEKFPFKFDRNDPKYREFENKLLCRISKLINDGTDTFYCGGARGFDILAAELVASIKDRFEVKLIMALAFPGQEKGWSQEWQTRFNSVVAVADEVRYAAMQYEKWSYHKRNHYMVDNSDILLTYYDGAKGGTASTVEYAAQKGLCIINFALNEIEDGNRQMELIIT